MFNCVFLTAFLFSVGFKDLGRDARPSFSIPREGEGVLVLYKDRQNFSMEQIAFDLFRISDYSRLFLTFKL